MSDSELDSFFVERLNEFLERFLPSMLTPKRTQRALMSGSEYAALVRDVSAAMNDDISDVSLFIPNIRARIAFDESVQMYAAGMEFDAKSMPLPAGEVAARHERRLSEALAHFERCAYGPTKEEMEERLRAELGERLASYEARNRKLSTMALFGFGDTRTLASFVVLVLLAYSVLSLSTFFLVLGLFGTLFYMDYWSQFSSHYVDVSRHAFDAWDKYAGPWAGDHPQEMAAIVLAISIVAWWFL